MSAATVTRCEGCDDPGAVDVQPVRIRPLSGGLRWTPAHYCAECREVAATPEAVGYGAIAGGDMEVRIEGRALVPYRAPGDLRAGDIVRLERKPNLPGWVGCVGVVVRPPLPFATLLPVTMFDPTLRRWFTGFDRADQLRRLA